MKWPRCDSGCVTFGFLAAEVYGRTMAYNYDDLYKTTPNALGDPTKAFVDFFSRRDLGQGLRVLDIGCGQGRDALFIAKLDHRVVGVDLSPSGIADLTASAQKQNLAITGIVADITQFTPEGDFDILLIDRTLHMLDEGPRLKALGRLIDHVAPNGWVLIADESSNIAGFKTVFDAHCEQWSTEVAKKGTLFLKRS